MNIFDHYRQRYEAAKDEEFTLQEFLTICRQDRSAYANAAERLLMAIGEPNMVDTAQEPRLSRLFSNRVVARYPAFEEFYGHRTLQTPGIGRPPDSKRDGKAVVPGQYQPCLAHQ